MSSPTIKARIAANCRGAKGKVRACEDDGGKTVGAGSSGWEWRAYTVGQKPRSATRKRPRRPQVRRLTSRWINTARGRGGGPRAAAERTRTPTDRERAPPVISDEASEGRTRNELIAIERDAVHLVSVVERDEIGGEHRRRQPGLRRTRSRRRPGEVACPDTFTAPTRPERVRALKTDPIPPAPTSFQRT